MTSPPSSPLPMLPSSVGVPCREVLPPLPKFARPREGDATADVRPCGMPPAGEHAPGVPAP